MAVRKVASASHAAVARHAAVVFDRVIGRVRRRPPLKRGCLLAAVFGAVLSSANVAAAQRYRRRLRRSRRQPARRWSSRSPRWGAVVDPDGPIEPSLVVSNSSSFDDRPRLHPAAAARHSRADRGPLQWTADGHLLLARQGDAGGRRRGRIHRVRLVGRAQLPIGVGPAPDPTFTLPANGVAPPPSSSTSGGRRSPTRGTRARSRRRAQLRIRDADDRRSSSGRPSVPDGATRFPTSITGSAASRATASAGSRRRRST